MCKLSIEKCICFSYLVGILFVSICSAIPIDDPAVPSMRNGNFRDSADFKSAQNADRLRHHRQLRARTRELRTQKPPIGHIEATVYQNDSITSPMSLTNISSSRSQRSSGSSRHRSKCECQPEHYTMKAYKSDIVVLVKAQGIERTNYTVSFLLLNSSGNSILKTPSSFPIQECLMVQFSPLPPHRRENCHKPRRGGKNLVRANITASQEYVLFLNVSNTPGANECFPVFSPERITDLKKPKWDKMLSLLRKVSKPKFKPRHPYNTTVIRKQNNRNQNNRKQKIKLVCKTRAMPLPRISWKRNNVTLCNNNKSLITMTYSVKDEDYSERKRRMVVSKLLIQKPSGDDFGRYECVIHGANSTDSTSIEVPNSAPFRKSCKDSDSEFCPNGKCYLDYNNEKYCECEDGYYGQRCFEKTPPRPVSRFPKTTKYACNEGLSTKYFCPTFEANT
ncbi:pro-neuregulin-2, membrane-bound isoform-like isoform X2 [Euwallacea similis]|uniref:pro-neuregulin-2, membrane-bound isoform-like isoform X2 n=1 Tax=Euwallacea similis TaxID=1736056 RepID=UPI00344B0B71